MTHDYKRNGTTTLFPALNTSTARSSAYARSGIDIRNGCGFCGISTADAGGQGPAFDPRQLLRPTNTPKFNAG